MDRLLPDTTRVNGMDGGMMNSRLKFKLEEILSSLDIFSCNFAALEANNNSNMPIIYGKLVDAYELLYEANELLEKK